MILTPKFGRNQKAEAKKWLKGLDLAEFLGLKKVDRGNMPCGFDTSHGMMSAKGLYESIKNILQG